MPVFAYFDVWCIADSRTSAVRQIADSLEASRREINKHLAVLKGPFEIVCCDERSWVSEEEFCLCVSRDQHGIVQEEG